MSIAAGPDAVDSGIVLVYDAANTNCYPGSGSSITDISNNGYVGTLLNSVGFSTANGGVLTFNGTNQQITNGFKPSGARSYFIWVKYNKITGLPNSFSLTGTQEINAYNYIGIYDGGTFYYYAGTTGNNLASVFLKSRQLVSTRICVKFRWIKNSIFKWCFSRIRGWRSRWHCNWYFQCWLC